MVFFRVTKNINIKVTDGTLVKYLRLKKPSEMVNDNIYCTTYDDVGSIQEVCAKVDDSYKVRIIDENKITSLKEFPTELGISNKNEYNILKEHESEINKKNAYFIKEQDNTFHSFALNEEKSLLHNQLNPDKKDITLAIIGGIGKDIGEMVNALSAVRILYESLQTKHESVKIDLYLIASNNPYYSRNKEIIKNEEYINEVYPLSLSVQKLCEYDYYIDTSSIRNSSYYSSMPFVDAYLHKFGIDYTKISDLKKHNQLNLSGYKPTQALENKIKELKSMGELILYHPYSSEISRSIPEDTSIKLLQKLIKKSDHATVVSVLEINKSKDDSYINLSKYSRTFSDFAYIISNMDKIITVDTSTYHISDAFFIPTVVLFSTINSQNRIKYYSMTKSIDVIDKTKHLSQFTFNNDQLALYKFAGWEKIKMSKVIKVLEKIR